MYLLWAPPLYCILTDTQTTHNPQLNGQRIRLFLNLVVLIFVSKFSYNYFTFIKHRWKWQTAFKTHFHDCFRNGIKWPVNLLGRHTGFFFYLIYLSSPWRNWIFYQHSKHPKRRRLNEPKGIKRWHKATFKEDLYLLSESLVRHWDERVNLKPHPYA